MSLVVMRRKYRCTRNGNRCGQVDQNKFNFKGNQSVMMRRKHHEISNSKPTIKRNIYRNKHCVVGGSSVTNNKSINYHSYYNKKRQRCLCDKSITVKSRVQDRKDCSQNTLDKKLKVLQRIKCNCLDVLTDANGVVAGNVLTLQKVNLFVKVGMVVTHANIPKDTTITNVARRFNNAVNPPLLLPGLDITLSNAVTVAAAGVQKLILKTPKTKKRVCVDRKHPVGYTRKEAMTRYCNTTKDIKLNTSYNERYECLMADKSYNCVDEKSDVKIKDSAHCGVY